MENTNSNFLIFEALERIYTLSTSKISMFSIDDKYKHPPFMRFKFKEILKDDEIYSKLRLVVENFSGNVKWKLITKDNIENYLLIPAIFTDLSEFGHFYNKEYYISKYGEDRYIKEIDAAIEDIPILSKLISHCHL